MENTSNPLLSEWERLHPAPFTLFQNDKGFWGTRDANGKVYDDPVYTEIKNDDGRVTYYDGHDSVCEFNPEYGMDIIAWGQPWWEDAYTWAKYPEEYDEFIFENLRANRQLDEEDGKRIAAFNESACLTAEQHQALSDLVFYCRWNSLPEDDDEERFAQEWFRTQPVILKPQQRVDCLVPLMQDAALDPAMKSTIWFANFCFIDIFLNEIK